MFEFNHTISYFDENPLRVYYANTRIEVPHKNPVYWIFNCNDWIPSVVYVPPPRTLGKRTFYFYAHKCLLSFLYAGACTKHCTGKGFGFGTPIKVDDFAVFAPNNISRSLTVYVETDGDANIRFGPVPFATDAVPMVRAGEC